MTRGGDFTSSIESIRTGARAPGPATSDASTGFRVVISPLTLDLATQPTATATPGGTAPSPNPPLPRGRSFRPVNITAGVRILPGWRLNWLTGSTFDVINAGTFEFEMAKNREVIALRATFNETAPESVTLKANVRRASAVHVLIAGSYVVDVAKGVRIGRIRLQFDKGGSVNYDLINGVNLREGWEPKSAVTNLPPNGVPGVTWRNLTEQPQLRGGIDAVGYLDMLTLRIPAPYSTEALVGIILEDTSRSEQSVKDPTRTIDPSFIVAAVTIESAAALPSAR